MTTFFIFQIVLVTLELPNGFTGGPIFSQCAPAGHPLSIQCDNWSVIYVRQTMYSEYYGVPNVGCQLPAYNSLCHAFSNSSDFYYNGKYQAEHTFLSQKLVFVGRTFGVNCNESATVRVVQVLYECLTELERPSICEERNTFGDVDGMLFNPGFPDPVRKQYGECSCRISATDWGVVRLSAIIINPIHPHTGTGRWSLNVKLNNEQVYSLDQMYRLSADIGIPDTNSLTLEYRNGGDTMFLPVMVPRIPSGFWVKYSAFPATSRIHMTCTVKQEEGTQLSPGLLAVIGSITVLSALILGVIAALFVRRNFIKRRKNPPFVSRCLKQHGSSSTRSTAFSGLNKEFHFLRRCNTLSSLSRYNSLPPNFIFKHNSRKMSSAKSQDSGIAVIDFHRSESFKNAVSSDKADDSVENETKLGDSSSAKQEVTSVSEKEKSSDVSQDIPEFGFYEFLAVLGATSDEIDV